MQQHDSGTLIHKKEHRLNKSKRGEIVPRYIFPSPPYYWKEHKDEELEQKT
jgi:hypothetical protein